MVKPDDRRKEVGLIRQNNKNQKQNNPLDPLAYRFQGAAARPAARARSTLLS